MIFRRSFLTLTAVACLTLFGDLAQASHPFHVTLAEIEFNKERNSFEVALCVWPEDLEKAISKMEKRTFDIDAETEKKRDALFKKYVARNFRFKSKSSIELDKTTSSDKTTSAEIRWVGSEIKIKQGWLYFEVEAKSDSATWTIENDMFFELNEDQMNHVQISQRRNWESRTLSAKTPSTEWKIQRD